MSFGYRDSDWVEPDDEKPVRHDNCHGCKRLIALDIIGDGGTGYACFDGVTAVEIDPALEDSNECWED